MSAPVQTIDLLRHGQVEGPPALYGRSDVLASAHGLQQMCRQMQRWPAPDAIISSPLLRCQTFAREFARANQLTVQLQDDFQECHFGQWDGVPFQQFDTEWAQLEAFWKAPDTFCPPGGESLHQFHSRVAQGWHEMLNCNEAVHTVIVCHGGVIRQILAMVLGLDWRSPALYSQLKIGYASLTRLSISAGYTQQPNVQFIGLPADQGGTSV